MGFAVRCLGKVRPNSKTHHTTTILSNLAFRRGGTADTNKRRRKQYEAHPLTGASMGTANTVIAGVECCRVIIAYIQQSTSTERNVISIPGCSVQIFTSFPASAITAKRQIVDTAPAKDLSTIVPALRTSSRSGTCWLPS